MIVRRRTLTSGFTLVELSVVLVIIGLLVGGIVLGQSVIRNAEVQSVITDITYYRQAAEDFRAKYFSLPGDMPDAESYWGSDTGCPATATNTTPKRETCNGDGDGKVAYFTAGAYSEWFRFWQHLSNAGMISGLYTGVTGPNATSDVVVGLNIPKLSLQATGISISWDGNSPGNANIFAADYGHDFRIGRDTNSHARGPAMTPAEAYQIDSKIDDTLPGTGIVMSYKATALAAPGCATTDDPSTAVYALSTDSQLCALIVKTGF